MRRRSTSIFFKLAEIQICEPPYTKYEYQKAAQAPGPWEGVGFVFGKKADVTFLITSQFLFEYFASRARCPGASLIPLASEMYYTNIHLLWKGITCTYLWHGSRREILCILALRGTWHVTTFWYSYFLLFQTCSFTYYLNFSQFEEGQMSTSPSPSI